MYPGVPFSVCPMEQVEADIDEASRYCPDVERVFLEHGDAFVLSADRLVQIADAIAICNQHWLVQIMGTLTTLYAIIVLVSAFMKLQIAVDAFRGSRPFWYLMAISTISALIIAALLFFHPFPETATWIVAGIALIAVAVLDGAYFWLGRK